MIVNLVALNDVRVRVITLIIASVIGTVSVTSLALVVLVAMTPSLILIFSVNALVLCWPMAYVTRPSSRSLIATVSVNDLVSLIPTT